MKTNHLRNRVLFALVCLAAGCYEAWALFLRKIDHVLAKGGTPVVIREFGDGATVAQTFRMVENGLDSVSLAFVTDSPATIRLACELIQLWDGAAGAQRLLHQQTAVLDRVSGRERRTIEFPSVPFSRNWRYTFKVRLVDATRADTRWDPSGAASIDARPRIGLVAFRENWLPDGSLVVNGREQPGALSFSADGAGQTVYERFRLRVGPRMPAALQHAMVQLTLLFVYNAALAISAYSLRIASRGSAP